MDFGLYNKKSQARGDHATLIGNWYEERALKEETGYTRHMPYSLEKIEKGDTEQRVINHTNNKPDPDDNKTTFQSSYRDIPAQSYPDKFFNRTKIQVPTSSNPYESAPSYQTQNQEEPQPTRRMRYGQPVQRYGPLSLPSEEDGRFQQTVSHRSKPWAQPPPSTYGQSSS